VLAVVRNVSVEYHLTVVELLLGCSSLVIMNASLWPFSGSEPGLVDPLGINRWNGFTTQVSQLQEQTERISSRDSGSSGCQCKTSLCWRIMSPSSRTFWAAAWNRNKEVKEQDFPGADLGPDYFSTNIVYLLILIE